MLSKEILDKYNRWLNKDLEDKNLSIELKGLNEDAIAEWVVSALNTVGTMKNAQTIKQACAWNKVGAKISTGFALFR